VPIAPDSVPAPAGRRAPTVRAAVVAAAVLALAACPGNLVHSFETFEGAVDDGAGCAELFDQRARFSDGDTLAKVDRELARIGCHNPTDRRRDR